MADQFEVRVSKQVSDVALPSGEKIIQANHLVALVQKTLAKMGAEKARSAGDQDPHALQPSSWQPHNQGSIASRPRSFPEIPSLTIVQIELNNGNFTLISRRMNLPKDGTTPKLDLVESQVVAFFVDGVRVLGLPRSIGEIYGLLFISRSPQSLDDLVRRLNMSKGSASQGIRMLKSLGAVREADGHGGAERRTYYEPAVELKRLVGGFIREQIRPHVESGKTKISLLAETAREVEDPNQRQFLSERVERLDHWMRSGSRVLPVLQKILGQ
jgi:DNA-binding transcriptional regulator GbsR (MarR family)